MVTDTALAATVQPSPQEVKDILVDQQQGRGVAGELIVAEEDEQFGEEAQAEDDVEEGLGPFQQGLIAAGQQLENPHVAAKLHEVQKTDFITPAHQQRLFVGSQNNMPFQQDFIVASRQLEELHAGRIAAGQQLVELHTLMQLQKGFGPTQQRLIATGQQLEELHEAAQLQDVQGSMDAVNAELTAQLHLEFATVRQQRTRCKEEPALQTPQQAARLSAWVAGLDQLRLTCRELGMHDEECSKLQSEVLSWAVGSGLPANGGRPESVGTGSPSAVPEVFTGQWEAVAPTCQQVEGRLWPRLPVPLASVMKLSRAGANAAVLATLVRQPNASPSDC